MVLSWFTTKLLQKRWGLTIDRGFRNVSKKGACLGGDWEWGGFMTLRNYGNTALLHYGQNFPKIPGQSIYF